ncbi:glycosyltransferase family 4 protein [Geodermatophilus normandii]|uniref:glycosyltransferase family 4 protein n=1 Tax=Geodermatophilus normandii TaxID=1137989 RepID=UPI0014767B3B|nr:glycosyltransferase family 4 protein [Geodermatophilus normandii]
METAIRVFLESGRRRDYTVMTLTTDDGGHPEAVLPGRGLNNPLTYLSQLARLVRRPPAVLVVSLWRAALLGAVVKVLRPRVQLVVFLHNVRYKNRPDRWCHRAALAVSDVVFVDSEAAREALVPDTRQPVRRITFKLRTDVAAVRPTFEAPWYLAYWGRLSPQKRIDRALQLLATMRHREDCRLLCIGTDDGDGDRLRKMAAELGVEEYVEWLPEMPFPSIEAQVSRASFFVQLSDFEGMAMSVVEAMQMGLVPVVSPVGEIRNYADDGINALVFRGDVEELAGRVLDVIGDPQRWRTLHEAAMATWRETPGYTESFSEAIDELLTSARRP